MAQIQRVVSGGQTGADQAGLAAALFLDIPTGGWAPAGFRTERGPAPFLAKLGLKEHPSPDYKPRTRANVQDSDATVVFGDHMSPGSALTFELVREEKKPVFYVRWFSGQSVPDPHFFRNFLDSLPDARVLNVAGNRESKQPGITDACFLFLVRTFA